MIVNIDVFKSFSSCDDPCKVCLIYRVSVPCLAFVSGGLNNQSYDSQEDQMHKVVDFYSCILLV